MLGASLAALDRVDRLLVTAGESFRERPKFCVKSCSIAGLIESNRFFDSRPSGNPTGAPYEFTRVTAGAFRGDMKIWLVKVIDPVST
jgi:hypothetical protein